jgi:hypothetical protein
MSDREKVCAEKWLHAAIDAEDPDLADYWKEKGLEARLERLAGPNSEPIAEPPIPEPKPRKAKARPTCDLCGSPDCKDSSCLI